MHVMTSFRDRFRPPYTVEQTPGGFVVKDTAGNELAFIYIDPDPASANSRFRMTAAEGRVWAQQIAALGER